MHKWRNLFIYDLEHKAMKFFYQFRGGTNEHLRRLIFGHLDSDPNGQKANISRITKRLRDKGLIASSPCWPYSKELIHYLKPKGIEYCLENFEIDSTNKLAGFDDIMGQFSAELLKPPLTNIGHHMDFMGFVTQFSNNKVKFRNNLYCVHKYETLDKKNKRAAVKPDGELLLEDQVYAIEIDTGSERYDMLVDKFNNYRMFFDFCFVNNIPFPWCGILFVTKRSDEDLDIENDQRWQTIIRAAIAGLQNYCWIIHVFGLKRTSLVDLLNQPQKLHNLGIPLPPKENPIELKKKEEEQKYKELKKAKEEEIRILEEKISRENRERDKIVTDELNREARERWNQLPNEERTIKVGLLKKRVENEKAKQAFIENYVKVRFEKRKLDKFGLFNEYTFLLQKLKNE